MYEYCHECRHYLKQRIGAHGGEYGYCSKKEMAVIAVHKACVKYFEAKKNDSKRDL